ncbi:MAG: LON peptidase substrate-binding domain-containing protein [Solirubrobacteraceae bacterium]
MSEDVHENFPLFPLGIVALPSEQVPLHIFEDRYLRMIEGCLEHGSEFGILWLAEEELKSIGCACRIERVLERAPDGTIDILALGGDPFRLLARQEDMPYPAGTVQMLCDQHEQLDTDAASAAHEVYAQLVEAATDTAPSAAELQVMDSYRMAATVDFGSDAKQQLLELRSENARLALLSKLLRAAIKHMELVEQAQGRARSNGKVRFG